MANDKADSAPTTPPSAAATGSIPPEFVKKIETWVSGTAKPEHPLSPAIVDDIKVRLAEREAMVKKIQEVERSIREVTTQHTHLSGRIDGLAETLYRLETHASG